VLKSTLAASTASAEPHPGRVFPLWWYCPNMAHPNEKESRPRTLAQQIAERATLSPGDPANLKDDIDAIMDTSA